MKRGIFILFILGFLSAKSQCDTTLTITVTPTATGGTATWAIVPGAITYSWGVLPGSGSTVRFITGATNSNTVTFTGLVPNTAYRFEVVTICSGSTSSPKRTPFLSRTQTVVYTPMTAAGYQFKYLRVDSMLHVSAGDTSLARADVRQGAIVYKNSDSLFYGWNGRKWNSLGGNINTLTASIANKVDTIFYNTDTIFYKKNNVKYAVVLGLKPLIDTKLNIGDTADFATRTWSNIVHPRFDGVYNNPTWVNTLHTDKLFNSSATFPQSLVADGSGGFVPYTLPALYTSDTASMLVPYLRKLDTTNQAIRAITLNTSGSIHTSPTDFTKSGTTWSGTLNLATQPAFSFFHRGTGTGTPSFRQQIFLNKDSLPITTSLVWGTALDTTTNRLSRQRLFTLPSLTSGSVLFSDGTNIAQDNSNLFWDNTNKILTSGNATSGGISAGGTGSTSLIIRSHNNYLNPGIVRVVGNNNPFEFYQRASTSNPYVFRFSSTDTRSMGNATANDYIRIGDFTYGNPTANNYNGNILHINPIYNITSSTGTILRGIFYNPSISSLTGTTHRAIETTTGDVLFNTTSGNTLIGTTTQLASARLTVNGKIAQPTTANSPKGTATLVNGVVTISNTLATTGCFIQVNYRTGTALSGSSSILTVSSLVNNTSFTVTAYNAGAATTNTSDNNTIEYTISN